jgi:hypothetical protein
LSLEQASLVRDGAVHGEALVETKREGHRGLAGRRIVGGRRTTAQGPQAWLTRDSREMVVFRRRVSKLGCHDRKLIPIGRVGR